MESVEKGSTIANLICRFREAPPVAKAMRTKSSNVSEFWWNSPQSPQHASRIHSLDETESELIANYAALPDSYVDFPGGEFDSESPVPVSRVAINARQTNPQIMQTNRRSKVTEFNPGTDILQEWRSKRKRDTMDYGMHVSPGTHQFPAMTSGVHQFPAMTSMASPDANTYSKKQNYYEELINKYLPQPRGTQEHSVSNPIAHSSNTTTPVTSGIMREYSTSAKTSVQTMDTLSHGIIELEAVPLCNPDTNDVHGELGDSFPNENLSKEPLVQLNEPLKVDAETSTTDLRKKIDVVRQTKYIIQSETLPVKLLITQSAQTVSTKEVQVQAVPIPSPPTKEIPPIPPGIPANSQELEESLWSISSLTSEGPSLAEYADKEKAVEEKHTGVDTSLETDGIDDLTLFEEDELIKLFVGKARFYEQHIDNINTLLSIPD